jgi:hypothetical protein
VNILQPGSGVGGHCIAVDPWFIVDSAPEEVRLIKAAREVNDCKPEWVLEKIKAAIADALSAMPHKSMAEITVACLGLAFKPDVDDLRESPAVGIARSVAQLGCRVLAVEPHIDALPAMLQLPNISLTPFGEALEHSQVLCILVAHSIFARYAPELYQHERVVDVTGLLSSNADTEYCTHLNEALEQKIFRLEVQLNSAKYENHILLDRLHKIQEQRSGALRQGAVEYIKRRPTYRFGEILLNNSQSFTGWLYMPFVLIKQYRTYLKEEKQRGGVPLPALADFDDAYEGILLCQTVTYKLGKAFTDNIRSPSGWIRLFRALRKVLRDKA